MSSFTAHPVLTPHDDTMIAWQQACVQAADVLRPQHDRERLAKALTLAQEGAVTLDEDGAALVVSHGTRYRLDEDGICHCPDAQHRGTSCKHQLAVQIHRQATAFLASSTTDATPQAMTQGDRFPSVDRWAVTEAPASCCVRLHIGEIELMYTMRDIGDAALTSRVQHLTPWVQELAAQARERQTQLDTRRQQHTAAAARQAVEPSPPPPVPPASPTADLQALIQQAVQQALAAQAAASRDQPPAPRQAPDTTQPASPDGWCTRHQVAMERRSNAKGTWLSHWLADENRWCRGK